MDFTAAFFHTYWDIIGPSTTSAIQDFFRHGIILKGFNHTLISFIPKITCPTKVSDLRPISLCTNAFIKQRSIADNVLVVHELFHFMRHQRSMSKLHVALKLDILTYYFQLNRATYGYIHPTRDLRQGDRLSPLLFVLCAQGLSFMINQAVERNQLMGIQLNSHCPSISHLFFADDSIIFTTASVSAATSILSILNRYALASGQQINYDKSSVFFGSNVSAQLSASILNTLHMTIMDTTKPYLGMPIIISSSKTASFAYLLSKIKSKLIGWQHQLLSLKGKEILLKAVVYAIPIYSMMCLKLPVSLCKQKKSPYIKFLVGDGYGTRTTHKKLDKDVRPSPKDQPHKWSGGLGFKDAKLFNQSLLAKQMWQIICSPESLLFQILKGRYFSNKDITQATAGRSPSCGWRSLLFGLSLLKQGLIWQINSGTSMNILLSPWVPTDPSFIPQLNAGISSVQVPLYVAGLKNSTTSDWNESLIHTLFIPHHASAILSMHLPLFQHDDKLVWFQQTSGDFTAKSGYFYATLQQSGSSIVNRLNYSKKDWQGLWSLHIAPRLKLFISRAIHGGLPTRVALSHRRSSFSLNCARCGELESLDHMLLLCPFVQRICLSSSLTLLSSTMPTLSFHLILLHVVHQLNHLDPSKSTLNLFCYLYFLSSNPTLHNSSNVSVIVPRSIVSLLPQPGIIRIMYDVVTCSLYHCDFVGAVAMDSNSAIIRRFNAHYRHIWDPDLGEFVKIFAVAETHLLTVLFSLLIVVLMC
ncbi:uncharacterized protein LOC126656857 [Mercurialis annua]|uniref:uncharacterized protein LOC126656857 n=1 Tax=Mercurialis annua TaxID=3986 RepID=UPI00215ED18C|nr:uncharacterized protein LOC126656857 [Mercurialis annua]